MEAKEESYETPCELGRAEEQQSFSEALEVANDQETSEKYEELGQSEGLAELGEAQVVKVPGEYEDIEKGAEKKEEGEDKKPLGEEGDIFSQTYDIRQGDPFPQDPNAPQETHQFTIRAMLVGSLLGMVVTASNIYLGLKTGFTFGAQLFGAIFGFAILRFVSRTMPGWFGGGFFGPKENCTVQTVATAVGGASSIYVSSIPAMYTLGLLGKGPEDDFWRLVSFSAVTAYYGIFFAIPLRKFYILYQKLVFPTPSACALTIHSLHSGNVASSVIKKKAWSLVFSFAFSFFMRIYSNYVPGIIWSWHIFWWLYKLGWKGAISPENWGWSIQLSPAFLGVGFFTGLNAAYSFFLGSIIAWAIVGPIIANNGIAPKYSILSPSHPDWRSYNSMSLKSKLNPNGFDPVTNSSPRYWLLWPGVMIMLCASFAEVFMNGSVVWKGLKQASLSLYYRISRKKGEVFKAPISDPAPLYSQIPFWQWFPLLILSIIFTCIVLFFQFGISVGLSLFSIFLGFIFSFIGAQSSGTTDVNPISTCAKSSQLILGAVSRAQHMDLILAQRLNLIAGSVSACAAAQSVDMIGDLKTGHLLGARPRIQFYAQVSGIVVSVWLNVVLYILFNKAYPCFITQFTSNYSSSDICVFGAPAVAAWRAIASAMTSPQLPVPLSSVYASLGLGVLSVIVVVYKYSYCPQKYRDYVPNFNAIGLGFVIPQTYYSIAMIIGAVVSHLWKKRKPVSYDIYALAIATGFTAGEGIGGVVNAVFEIAGLSGQKYGTHIGCPYDTWCG
ncbi:hypothetical protein PORY_001185 [Pneumocystis oryctolagi]|uniref:Uncharacterized protein n=1 Tax=Pneumocystis oryctolagi TaxID=42067 RepID=A0ACB7CIL1_9ASCO|nr:hypothetical protein PORY_001185 [Pneumocystis oryctolagi]